MQKKIHFKKITINWFKGIKELMTYDLKENEVEFDKNGTFKTTKLDAISFLFTNKLLNGNVSGWEHLNENNELLLHLAKNAEMGVSSTTKLLNTLKNKENKIKPLLENELKERPRRARKIVSENLGHHRTEVTRIYLADKPQKK